MGPPWGTGWVKLLDEDPDLGTALREPAEARERCMVRVAEFGPGAQWAPSAGPAHGADRLGFLVLEGVFLYRLSIAGGETADLLGPGDLLRPWATEDEYSDLLSSSRWQVVQHARVAVLDRGFLEQAASWPELAAALVDRAVRHSRSMAMRRTIAQIRHLGARIRLMLWQRADRFGKVDREGVIVPLRLSHGVLAELVCAKRPSVSRSLKELSHQRLVVRVPEGWRLCGAPPAALAAVLPTPVASRRPRGNGSLVDELTAAASQR